MHKRWFAPLLGLLCAALLCGCGGSVKVTADISAYADTPIAIAGLTEQEFNTTPGALAQLECVTQTATGATAKSGTVTAVGPTLNTFLAQYGKTQTDFDRVRFIGGDAYRVVLYEEDLAEFTIYLSVAEGTNPLPAEQLPLRVLIPGADTNTWARMVTRIEFVPKQ